MHKAGEEPFTVWQAVSQECSQTQLIVVAWCVQETYAYAKTLLDVATSSADGRPRALLVGGGIANFTDVAATFKGIIQVGFPHLCSRHYIFRKCLYVQQMRWW